MRNKKCWMEEYILTPNSKSLIVPFSSIMVHHFLLNMQLCKCFSVEFVNVSMHSFVSHIFYHNHFPCLRWLIRRYWYNCCYLVKEEQDKFYYRKTQFCACLVSIDKYHFARELHRLRCEKVPLLSRSVTEYVYHRFADHTWL